MNEDHFDRLLNDVRYVVVRCIELMAELRDHQDSMTLAQHDAMCAALARLDEVEV